MKKTQFINLINQQIIVSCQAVDQEPLNDVRAITLVARSVLEGGAQVLRLSQVEHIRAIQAISPYPVIGLIKKYYPDSEVFITATKTEVQQLLDLGVDCIALDATLRKRPHNEQLSDLVNFIRKTSPQTLIMADCASLADVIQANELDFDFIGTTLRGYTAETKGMSNIENDYQFLKDCLEHINKPLIAEGGFWEHDDIFNALQLGALAVVVGSAITRPKDITQRYFKQLQRRKDCHEASVKTISSKTNQ